MKLRAFLFATAALFGAFAPTAAQTLDDGIKPPMLRANVTVSSDVVRIGDLIDNAGTAAQMAVYPAPDLGTTGSITTAQVLTALRAHQVIGVTTGNIREVAVTRLLRKITTKKVRD